MILLVFLEKSICERRFTLKSPQNLPSRVQHNKIYMNIREETTTESDISHLDTIVIVERERQDEAPSYASENGNQEYASNLIEKAIRDGDHEDVDSHEDFTDEVVPTAALSD